MCHTFSVQTASNSVLMCFEACVLCTSRVCVCVCLFSLEVSFESIEQVLKSVTLPLENNATLHLYRLHTLDSVCSRVQVGTVRVRGTGVRLWDTCQSSLLILLLLSFCPSVNFCRKVFLLTLYLISTVWYHSLPVCLRL